VLETPGNYFNKEDIISAIDFFILNKAIANMRKSLFKAL